MTDPLVAPSGLRARRTAPDAPRGGVLLVPDHVEAEPGEVDAAVARLVAAGFVVVVPELGWRGGECLSDPDAIADLRAARDLLPPGRRFVVGLGQGGLYARLAACAVLGLAGAVSFGGRVSYPGVSAQRPMQPLDLLPGLGCPLQCHFDQADDDTPAGHVDELERRLSGTSQPWQVFRYPLPARRGDTARTAWGRVSSFLLHLAAAGA